MSSRQDNSPETIRKEGVTETRRDSLPMRAAKKCLRMLAWATGILALLYLFHAPLCRAVGHLWVVDDSADHADAAVILGGGTDWRPFAAADMYHKGKVKYVLLPGMKVTPSVEIGAKPSDTQVELAILAKHNVPSTAVALYSEGVQSCYDEAVGVANWCQGKSIKSVIIPTDPFHTRRVKWIFERKLRDTGIAVHVKSVNPPSYDLDNWWEQEEGVVNFVVELVKMTYYWLHY